MVQTVTAKTAIKERPIFLMEKPKAVVKKILTWRFRAPEEVAKEKVVDKKKSGGGGGGGTCESVCLILGFMSP